MTEPITVVENTKPVIDRVLRTFRDESAPSTAVNITGYEIRLAVKASADRPDSEILFDIKATLTTPAQGKYRFSLNAQHTALPPGTYAGQLRWWKSGGSGAGIPPDDSEALDYIVDPAIVKAET